jgi:serine phosphatase RsbU (regulator of sigma subunit)
MLLNLTNYSSEPIDDQIVNQILLRILEEEKIPGEELESIGKISRQHHIRKGSIEKAFKKLEQLGVIEEENEKYLISDISTRAIKSIIERNYFNSDNFSEYKLYNAEMDAARQIQNGLLPKELPDNKEISVSAYSTISEGIGGDFYDLFMIDEKRYGVIIGDASGKGFPAAMLISQIQAIIKSDLSKDRSILKTIYLINSYMNTYSSARYFATMFYGIINIESGELRYVNAGHNFPVIINSNDVVKRLNTTGPAIGIMRNPDYSEKVIDLSKNDLLFLFTDGLPERMNEVDEIYGEEKLVSDLIKTKDLESQTIIKKITEYSNTFSGNFSEKDNITFLAIKINNIE